MYKLVDSERKSEISEEELPDNGAEDDNDFNYFENQCEDDELEDDEPEEREYCD